MKLSKTSFVLCPPQFFCSRFRIEPTTYRMVRSFVELQFFCSRFWNLLWVRVTKDAKIAELQFFCSRFSYR